MNLLFSAEWLANSNRSEKQIEKKGRIHTNSRAFCIHAFVFRTKAKYAAMQTMWAALFSKCAHCAQYSYEEGEFYAFEVLFFISIYIFFFSLVNGIFQRQEEDRRGMKRSDGMLNCASTLADIDFTDGPFSLPMHLNGSLNYNIWDPGMCRVREIPSLMWTHNYLRWVRLNWTLYYGHASRNHAALAVHLIQQF